MQHDLYKAAGQDLVPAVVEVNFSEQRARLRIELAADPGDACREFVVGSFGHCDLGGRPGMDKYGFALVGVNVDAQKGGLGYGDQGKGIGSALKERSRIGVTRRNRARERRAQDLVTFQGAERLHVSGGHLSLG